MAVFDALAPKPNPHSDRFEFLTDAFLFAAKDTYDAIIILLEKGADYSLQASVLARFMMEILFNLLFIAQDKDSRSIWFGKVWYRNISRERKQCEERRADESKAARQQIDSYKKTQAILIRDFKISQMEICNPESIQNWLTPNRMLKTREYWGGKPEDDKLYFKYVLDSFYGHASELSHAELKSVLYGIAKRVSPTLSSALEESGKAKVILYAYGNTTVFFAAIMTEIARIKNVNINSLLVETWGHFYKKIGPDIDELIEFRYSQFIDKK